MYHPNRGARGPARPPKRRDTSWPASATFSTSAPTQDSSSHASQYPPSALGGWATPSHTTSKAGNRAAYESTASIRLQRGAGPAPPSSPSVQATVSRNAKAPRYRGFDRWTCGLLGAVSASTAARSSSTDPPSTVTNTPGTTAGAGAAPATLVPPPRQAAASRTTAARAPGRGRRPRGMPLPGRPSCGGAPQVGWGPLPLPHTRGATART